MPARIYDDLPLDGAADDQPIMLEKEVIRTEEVVVCGVAARLPESENMKEFRDNLMNNIDMVTEDNRRWEPGMHGLPRRNGKLKDISKFDASFFGVHPKQANAMDPQLRLLLEVTYEALVDAGVDPAAARGSRTGVFVGCSASEAHDAWSSQPEKLTGYEMTGCTRSMFANRLSYYFDFKGPSYAIDTACSSSLLALDQALNAIRSGLCDAAVIGGCNLCLKPSTSLQFQKLNMLSSDGTCKSFDVTGNGYCRSEAVVAIYIQRETRAKRIYATLVHSKNNSDGNKKEGITFPSGEVQKKLLKEVYSEAKVDPALVSYVEAHGTGTKAGDPQEVNSIVDVFCKGRNGPLLIGSTKSNMGHPEPASGLAALAKILVAIQEGYIPANLHFTDPNPDIPALADGRLKVVSENTSWNGGYIGVNSFGFGGSNVHVLLKSFNKDLLEPHPSAQNLRLATYAGRTEEAVEFVLQSLQEAPENVELQALVQETSFASAATHPYRGYCLLNAQNADMQVQECSPESRPTWFVFAGMGTQWHGMGRDMMSLDVFKESIMRSDAVLKQYLNLHDLIMNGDENTFENTINTFTCIAAIQVALVDLLKSLNIKADGIVGHSVGELGCAYADGGLTAEETVLAAYWRGRCVTEAKLPPGGMAAVGLTWEEAKQRCPKGVVPACHNSVDTVTISGPADDIHEFVEELKVEGVFAKEVKSGGVAFHSYFMAKTAPALKEALDKVIKEPRPRTARWVSSSIPEARWGDTLARYSSSEYHVNNLLSPVLFQEALQHVPLNAIVIEIAPHCLLQAILKRSLAPTCNFVGLMKRNHPNNPEFMFSSLGKCYMNGTKLTTLSMFPSVNFPVSRTTPMVSPLMKWDHSETWAVPKLEEFAEGGSGGKSGCVFEIDASESSEDHYLVGHKIDDRVLFPATGYLVLAWRTLAKLHSQPYENMAVAFENVHIHRATILPPTGIVKLAVSIMPGTGDFEVAENESLVVSGRIFAPNEPVLEVPVYDRPAPADSSLLKLTTADIYKELRLRGYDYGPTFQGILTASNDGQDGYLKWNDNWVSFLDTMLQIQILSLPGTGLRLPTRIKSLRIDPSAHVERVTNIDSQRQAVKVTVDRVLDVCVAGGAEILGLHATVAPRRQQAQVPPTIEKFTFVPHMESDILSKNKALLAYLEKSLQYIKSSLASLIDNGISNTLPNLELFKSVSSPDSSSSSNSEEMEELATKPRCNLLKTLQAVFKQEQNEQFLTEVKAQIKENSPEMHRDQLAGYLLTEGPLKNCCDTVLENGPPTKLKIVEVTASSSHLYEPLITQLNTQPLLKINYTLAGKDVESSDHLESYDVAALNWEPTNEPPNSLSSADLVTLSNTLNKFEDPVKVLKNITSITRDNGFVLIHEPTRNVELALALDGLLQDFSSMKDRLLGPYFNEKQIVNIIQKAGLTLVNQKSDGLLNSLFLCRKSVEEEKVSTIFEVDDLKFDWVESLKSSLAEIDEKPAGHTLWVTSKNLPSSGVIGMVNCLRQETGGQHVRCLFNASLDGKNQLQALTPESPEFEQLKKADLVMNIYRDGKLGAFRHTMTNSGMRRVDTSHAYVNVLTRGDLSSLHWIESPLKYFKPEQHPDKDLCSVYYTSLNFRDVMLATGKLPPDAIPGNMAMQDCILGMEFSGRSSNGNKIMGLLPAKGLATTVDADCRFLWEVPETWTLEEAASVPVVYTTVYYALVVRGQIKKGDRVLIHSGSGGVGQAAISVALHHGCEVFTTVGSQQKKDYLKQVFPQLTDRNFANSRDKTFEWDILRATNGKGVDVILNSLAEEKLQASVRILAQHGRFLEIGKFDLSNDSPLGMSVFLKNISFHGILLDALFEEGNSDWGKVSQLLCEGIKQGAVRPLKTTVFDKDDVEGAFRFMAQGKHIGKVLIKVREEENSKTQTPTPVRLHALARTACHPEKSYIITGGLGGFGLELSSWLIERGATKMVLTSRSGITSGYQSRCISRWKKLGVQVVVSTRNVSNFTDAKLLLEEAQKLGPLGGIFNLAMVLRDGLMENQTAQQFIQVASPKVQGTLNLDQATREMNCSSLDWFVAFSSVSCGRGNAGQANYGFANSAMERICEKRQRDGLPGLAIQWGAIGDVGVVLNTMGDNDTVVGGTLPQRILSCLKTIDTFLNQENVVMSSFVGAPKKTKSSDKGDKPDLVESIANVLGIKNIGSVGPEATLGDLGLDSLMGVEVKQTLERDYDLNLQMKEIRMLTFPKLKDIAGGSDTQASSSKNEASKKEEGGKTMNMHFDKTQMMPTEPLIQMKDGDSTKAPLFVVHPIEGLVKPLETMVSSIERKVYGLQCTADAPLMSISDLATFYISKMKTVQPEGPYHIAGYSFGASVAFEVASILESQGDGVSSLVMLDGSHAYVTAHVEQYTVRDTDTARHEAEAICAFVLQFTTIDFAKFMTDLLGQESSDARFTKATDHLMSGKLGFTDRDSLKEAMVSFYNKLVASNAYSPTTKVKSAVTLIRATAGHQQAERLGQDYGLAKVCSGTVAVHEVEGDHETFIQGKAAKQVASIINTTFQL